MTLAGLALYALNLGVGIAARWRQVGFGRFHHFLYALVLATTLAATFNAFSVGLLVTLLALCVLPAVSPRSRWHAALALAGLLGYLSAVFH